MREEGLVWQETDREKEIIPIGSVQRMKGRASQ